MKQTVAGFDSWLVQQFAWNRNVAGHAAFNPGRPVSAMTTGAQGFKKPERRTDREELPMRSRLLMSVSAAALIAGAGIASAQDKGPAAAPQNTSPAQQSATPPSQPGGGTMKGGSDVQQRQDGAPSRAQTDMDRGDQKQQRAQDRNERQDRQNAQDKSSPKAGSTASDASPIATARQIATSRLATASPIARMARPGKARRAQAMLR